MIFVMCTRRCVGSRLTLGLMASLLAACGGSGAEGDSEGETDEPPATSISTTGPDTGGGEPAELVHSLVDLPFGLSSTCDHDGTERILSDRNNAVTPERMYFAGCTDPEGVRRFYVSIPVGGGHFRSHPQDVVDDHSQLVFETAWNDAAGAYEVTDNAVHRPECLDGYGIAVASDCSTVATLCRRPHFTSETEPFTLDLVAKFGGGDIDAPGPIGGEPSEAHKDYNDEMWMYEWKGQALSEEPDKYVVHKGIGPLTRARGLGNYYLLNGENDDSYAYAVRSSTGGNTRHVADAFLMIDRSGSEYEIAPDRGYTWACGRGHTIFNRPVYNPATRQYAIWCNTDYNEEKLPGLNGMFFRTEDHGDGERNEFITVNGNGSVRQGGVQVLQPLPDGNYIGAFVGHPDHHDDWAMHVPTKIGLVKFDAATAQVIGEINWLVQDSDHYLGHAQLGVLGDDRYLLGYGRLREVDDPETDNGRRREEFLIPKSYHVVEINGEGQALTDELDLQGAGWGDLDQWVSPAAGEVTWAYIPNPELHNEARQGCSGSTLQISTYR